MTVFGTDDLKMQGALPSRRRFLLGAAAGAAALATGAVSLGRAAAAAQPLVFWSQLAGSKKPAGDALEAAFKAAHADIDLHSELYADPEQLNEKILTAINGNSAPDLFIQHWDYTLNYASGGKLLDLDKVMSEIATDAFDAGLTGYGRTTGPHYSVPLYGTSRGLGFNRKLVAAAGLDPDKPPTTWEELRTWAKAMTKRSGMLQVAGFSMFYNDLTMWEAFVLFLQGAGGSIFTADLKAPAFAGPEGIKALGFMNELINVDKVIDMGFGTGPGVADPFQQSRCGMIVAGNYHINNSLKAGIDFGVAAFPKETGGFTSLVDPFCFGVPAASPNTGAAVEFIRFALGVEQQAAFATASKNNPVLKAAQRDSSVQADPYLSKFVQFSGYAPAAAPSIPTYSRVVSIVARAIEETLYGRKQAAPALADAASQVQALLGA